MHPQRDPYCLRAITAGFILSALSMIAAILAAGTGFDLIGW